VQATLQVQKNYVFQWTGHQKMETGTTCLSHALVVLRMDNTIRLINHHPLHSMACFLLPTEVYWKSNYFIR